MSELSVLFFTKYGRKGASSRYRSYQYFDALGKRGIHCEGAPLFSDEYLRRMYADGRRPYGEVLRGYSRRLRRLLDVSRHDVVVVEKELFPYLPAWIERLASRSDVPYVADYDDAVFHTYDRSPNYLVRRVLGDKVDAVMENAALVAAGNNYLAEKAREAGAQRVEIVPTVVDISRYPEFKGPGNREELVLGWIGSPTTAQYLQGVRAPLAEVASRRPTKLVAIGSGPLDLGGIDVDVRPWTKASEIDDLADIDIGLMPLPDTPWERGKCGLKLLQYMAMGKPVIASPVGVNPEIVEPGVNGFLADTTEAWIEAIEALRDPKLRDELGRAGRAKVRAEYSLDVMVPRVADLLKEASAAV